MADLAGGHLQRVPRLRGDELTKVSATLKKPRCSPPTRGSIGPVGRDTGYTGVFPAYAGIDQTLNPAGLVKLIGEAVCIGTGLDRETLDAETVDVLVQLTARVIEVNADFLVREALPVFEAAVGGLAEMSSAPSEAGASAYSPEVSN